MKQTPEDVKAAAPYSAYVEKAINHLFEKSQNQNDNPNVRYQSNDVPNPNKNMHTLQSFVFTVKEDTARFGPQNLVELLFDLGDGVIKFNPNKPLVKALVAQYNKVFKGSGSDQPHSDQRAYQPAAGGARTSTYNTVQPGMGKR